MRKRLYRLTPIFLCFLLQVAEAQVSRHPRNTTGGHELLYQITKPGSSDTSYLFGTFHLLGQDYVDTMRNLMPALHRATLVVGEFSIADFKLSDLAAGMESPVPLDSLLTSHDYKLVARELKRSTGEPLSQFNQFKPLVIYGAIMSTSNSGELPTTQDAVPMDLYFQHVAHDSGQQVVGLESPKDQSTLLYDSIPLKEQVEMLLDLVKHPTQNDKSFLKMQREYMEGKVDELMGDPEMGMLSKRDKDLFLYHRNERWLGEFPAILDNHSAFIAVGAGHLVGPRGIVAGLRKLGYEVKGMSLN